MSSFKNVMLRIAGYNGRERGFSGAVGPHYGMDFACFDGQVYAFEYFVPVHAGFKVFYFEHFSVCFFSVLTILKINL